MRPIKRKILFGFFIFNLCLQCAFATVAAASSDVRYSDVRPIIISEQVQGSQGLELAIFAYGVPFRLVLQKNEKLLNQFQNPEKIKNVELYSGELANVPGSWARISKVRGKYNGAFFDGSELFLIDSVESVQDKLVYTETRGDLKSRTIKTDRVIYKSSSVESNGTCGMHVSGATNMASGYQALVEELETAVPNAVAASSATLEINVVIVTDTEYASSVAGNVTEEVMSQMNIVDGIFSEQIGVHINITNIMQLSSNGSLTSTDPLNLLSNFQAYVNSQVGNPGLAHLFTGKNLSGNTVGIAYLNRLCHSYGVGLTQAGGNGAFGALIAAHEFGHNFGAPHDNESGSACASTPGIYLMNPIINGSTSFSQCSRNQIGPSVNAAQCIGSFTPVPLFTSVPSITARVGLPYIYDADNRASAAGSNPITFSLNNGPTGMTVSETGLVSWIPQPGQEGNQPVQIIASNAAGNDTQSFTINVIAAPSYPVINFNQQPVTPFVLTEDISGTVAIENNGVTLRINGNRWKKIDFPYVITPDTVLEFDFSSSQEGEIHGIGMANYSQLDVSKIFRLYGTQNTGISTYANYSGLGLQHFVIPIGQHYTGVMQYLFFVMDDDINVIGESSFSNVRVYENVPPPPTPIAPAITSTPNTTATVNTAYSYDADSRVEASGTAPISYTLTAAPTGMTINNGLISWTPQAGQEGVHAVTIQATNSAGSDTQSFTVTVAAAPVNPGISFNSNPPSVYVSSEDGTGTVTVEDGGATIRLVGNRWQKINFPYTVTANTVLEFDFRSSVQGEIHGIGLDNDLFLSSNLTFQVYGTQSWGLLNYANYTGGGRTSIMYMIRWVSITRE
ncbi:MAG: hypothetical protein H6995_11625 [Pseudomonadales bacterium]|nr:hypothetical protein [Pseudomonadales bacterium]